MHIVVVVVAAVVQYSSFIIYHHHHSSSLNSTRLPAICAYELSAKSEHKQQSIWQYWVKIDIQRLCTVKQSNSQAWKHWKEPICMHNNTLEKQWHIIKYWFYRSYNSHKMMRLNIPTEISIILHMITFNIAFNCSNLIVFYISYFYFKVWFYCLHHLFVVKSIIQWKWVDWYVICMHLNLLLIIWKKACATDGDWIMNVCWFMVPEEGKRVEIIRTGSVSNSTIFYNFV